MKTKGRIISIDKQEKTAVVHLPTCPKEGTLISVSWGKARSLKQNNLYWQLLTWYVEVGGMKEQGYMFVEELHTALKGRLLSTIDSSKGFDTRVIGSTTNLKADEFMVYIEKIGYLLQQYCGVSAKGFWEEYVDTYVGE